LIMVVDCILLWLLSELHIHHRGQIGNGGANGL
jgi:hypothetical protein